MTFNLPCTISTVPECDCEIACWRANPFDSGVYATCKAGCISNRATCTGAVDAVVGADIDCVSACSGSSGAGSCAATLEIALRACTETYNESMGTPADQTAEIMCVYNANLTNLNCVAAVTDIETKCAKACNVAMSTALPAAWIADSKCTQAACSIDPQSYAVQRLACDSAAAMCRGPVEIAFQSASGDCESALASSISAANIRLLTCNYGCSLEGGDITGCQTGCVATWSAETGQSGYGFTFSTCNSAAQIAHDAGQAPCYVTWNTCLNAALGVDLGARQRRDSNTTICGGPYNSCWAKNCEGPYLLAYVGAQNAISGCTEPCNEWSADDPSGNYWPCIMGCSSVGVQTLSDAAVALATCGLQKCCQPTRGGGTIDPYSQCVFDAWKKLQGCIATATIANPPFLNVYDSDYFSKNAAAAAALVAAVTSCQSIHDSGDIPVCNSSQAGKRTCAMCEVDAISVGSQNPANGLYPFPPLQWWPNP